MSATTAKRRPPPRSAPPAVHRQCPQNLHELQEAFLPSVAPSTHPAFRSTLCLAARAYAGHDDLQRLPLTQVPGLLRFWKRRLEQQVAAGQLSAKSAAQYLSRLVRLVRWAQEELAPHLPISFKYLLVSLFELDPEHAPLLEWIKDQHLNEYHALRGFFLYTCRRDLTLDQVMDRIIEITADYCQHLQQQYQNPRTWKDLYSSVRRALRRLRDQGLLNCGDSHDPKDTCYYRLAWQAFPNTALRQAVVFFFEHATKPAAQNRRRWPWPAVSETTARGHVLILERYIGFLVNHYPGGGLDLPTMTLEQVFSREHLKAYRAFYLARNGPRPSTGLASAFQALRVFVDRAMRLDLHRFDNLYNPQTRPRTRDRQQRTLGQWNNLIQKARHEAQQTNRISHRLSLERLAMFLQIEQATLERITAIHLARVDHLTWKGTRYVLTMPAENRKKTRRRQPQGDKTIPLPPELNLPLRRYLEQIRPQLIPGRNNPYLFPAIDSDGPVDQAMISRQLKDLDQELHQVDRKHTTSCHRMRATHASIMARHQPARGVFQASKILEHTTTQTTRKHYVHHLGVQQIRHDLQIRRLIQRDHPTDQQLRDALEIQRRDPGEWMILHQELRRRTAQTAPPPQA